MHEVSPVDDSTDAVLSFWEPLIASTTKLYMTFGGSEVTEPITVFGPNDAKATSWLCDFTVILYEVAPEYLVHLRVTVFDVAENTDTLKSNEGRAKIIIRHIWHPEKKILSDKSSFFSCSVINRQQLNIVKDNIQYLIGLQPAN